MVLKTWKWVDASWQSLSWKNASKISRKQGENCFHQGATMEKVQNCQVGDFLVVQWYWFGASNAGHIGSIPGQGTKIPSCCMAWSKLSSRSKCRTFFFFKVIIIPWPMYISQPTKPLPYFVFRENGHWCSIFLQGLLNHRLEHLVSHLTRYVAVTSTGEQCHFRAPTFILDSLSLKC